MWLCSTFARSARGAVSLPRLRKTAVPGPRYSGGFMACNWSMNACNGPSSRRRRRAAGDVDVLRFERLVEEGRQGRPERWREALEEWTGDAALADLADVPFAHAAAARLDELRLTVTEELIERELALGHRRRAVPRSSCLGWG